MSVAQSALFVPFVKNSNMKIGSKIRAMRIEHNLSSVQVAEMLNVSESTYRKYETDRSSPSLDMLEKIARLYQKEVVDLLPEICVCQENNGNAVGINNGRIIYQMGEKLMAFYEQRIVELEEENRKLRNIG